MFTYLFGVSYFVVGVLIGLRLTQLSKDIKHIRISIDDIEEAIDRSTWVVYENDEHVH